MLHGLRPSAHDRSAHGASPWRRALAVALTTGVVAASVFAGASSAAATGKPGAYETYSVGAYIYKKADPSKPAAWANSTEQFLVAAWKGKEYRKLTLAEVQAAVDVPVCGDGWGVQEDKAHGGVRVFTDAPRQPHYPNSYIGWVQGEGYQPGKLYHAGHWELKDMLVGGQVPPCGPASTPAPTTTPTATPVPTQTPAPTSTPAPSTPAPSATPTAPATVAKTCKDVVTVGADGWQDKVDADRGPLTVAAPAGFLIDAYCVKAGSGVGAAVTVPVDVPSATVTVTHPSGKRVSHYCLHLVPVVPAATPTPSASPTPSVTTSPTTPPVVPPAETPAPVQTPAPSVTPTPVVTPSPDSGVGSQVPTPTDVLTTAPTPPPAATPSPTPSYTSEVLAAAPPTRGGRVLAATGSSVGPVLAIAGVLVAGGAGLLVARQRRLRQQG